MSYHKNLDQCCWLHLTELVLKRWEIFFNFVFQLKIGKPVRPFAVWKSTTPLLYKNVVLAFEVLLLIGQRISLEVVRGRLVLHTSDYWTTVLLIHIWNRGRNKTPYHILSWLASWIIPCLCYKVQNQAVSQNFGFHFLWTQILNICEGLYSTQVDMVQ